MVLTRGQGWWGLLGACAFANLGYDFWCELAGVGRRRIFPDMPAVLFRWTIIGLPTEFGGLAVSAILNMLDAVMARDTEQLPDVAAYLRFASRPGWTTISLVI